MTLSGLAGRIFDMEGTDAFNDMALELFRIQAAHVPVYKEMLRIRRIKPEAIREASKIPFLPIRFFKTHDILVEGAEAEMVFESSGTTGNLTSRHFVHDAALYRKSAVDWFTKQYGLQRAPVILALLPGYAERPNASLVTMLQWLMASFPHPENGFYHDDTEKLVTIMQQLERDGSPYILWGVTHALLKLASVSRLPMRCGTIIETGGMKGHGQELIREEVHDRLRASFGDVDIDSEYGMTELLSQAYARDGKHFQTPPWMSVDVYHPDDRTVPCPDGYKGVLHITDLANIYSCAFIASDDVGRKDDNGRFEVLGRMDNSELRGCNMMV